MKYVFSAAMLLAVVGVLTGCLQSSKRQNEVSVPGLSRDLQESLEGVWEPFSTLGRQADHEEWKSRRMFSWGEGKLSPASAVIDFGSNPPSIEILGIMTVALVSAAQPEPDHVTFTTRNLFGEDGTGERTPIDRIDIVLRSDGSLEFRGTIGNDLVITDPEEWRFFRTYGPGISE